MFTGLIRAVGTIETHRPAAGAGLVLAVRCPDLGGDLALGDSVAVDGACLTVTGLDGDRFDADVSAETLDRTTLRQRRPGDHVNLEPALRLGDRLGGHLMTGHIDGVGRITGRRTGGNAVVLTVTAPDELMPLIVEKGSIALDGVSLTVNKVRADRFSLTIIPHTLDHTTLTGRREGDAVNLETDILGKYVARLLARAPESPREGITLETLAENGFL